MLYFEQRNIVNIFCDVCTHRSRNNIEGTLTLVSENLEKATQFPVPSSFFKGFQT